MNHRAPFVALCLFISLRSAAMAQIINGSFETGDFTGWGADQEGAAVTTDPLYVHSGIYGVELGTVGTMGHLTQTLATVPGSDYLVSLWLDNPSAGIPNAFQVTWNQTVLYDSLNLTNQAWTNIQLTVTASTPNDILQLAFRHDLDFLGLDDINVTSVAPSRPSIVLQPTNETVTLGSNATFVVTATGVPMPNYYWWQNSAPVTGPTNSSYSITNVPWSASGSQFFCVASNASGTATSHVATLTLIPLPPLITRPPASQAALPGGYASFSVTASGSQPLNYFWLRNNTFIVGATNSDYSLDHVQATESGSVFSCIVSNAFGAVLSSDAFLKVTTNIPASTVIYLRTAANEPWGLTDNDALLTQLYGAGWKALYYETVDPAALLSPTNKFIFMEGSADSEPAMETFLLGNMPALTNWVAAGGSLFLDCAPYFIHNSSLNVGFGVTISVGDFSDTALAADISHPIFNGPFTPVGGSFRGGYFGNATVSGPGLSGILTNASGGKPILAEGVYGAGHLMFGGATLPAFQTPQPQASNLWANILFNAGLQSAVAQPLAPLRTTLSLSPVGMNNCTFSFWAKGPAATNFLVQISSNLQYWTTILTNTMPSQGSVLITDPSACNSAPRFYRGVLPN